MSFPKKIIRSCCKIQRKNEIGFLFRETYLIFRWGHEHLSGHCRCLTYFIQQRSIQMSYITKRGNSYSVRYTYEDEHGKSRDKWESFPTKEEATNRKKQIEHELAAGTFLIPSSVTVAEFLMDWLPKQCSKHKWAPKTYESNLSTIQNLIIPYIGSMEMLFRLPNGLAVEPVLIRKKFLKWQDAHPEFPRIVFHGLRHSSATYQLIISGGDVKAVQGTTGHATADMLVNTYAHIQQSSRVELGNKFEEGFYAKQEIPSPQAVPAEGEPTISMSALLELLKNADPEVKAQLRLALLT